MHVAEYNALTTRCTYIMTIHLVVLAALITWLTVMGSIIDTKPDWFKWVIIFGGQTFAIISAMFSYGYYKIIQYLETVLIPMICSLTKINNFWRYQSFVAQNRIKGFTAWELSGLVFDITVIVWASLSVTNWTAVELFGFFLNVSLLLVYCHRLYNAIKVRLIIKRAVSSFPQN